MAKQTFTTGQVLTAAQMTSLQQTAMLGGAANAKVASYVLVAADAGDAITMSNASPTTITVNTGLFATGDTVTIINLGAGACTITAGTATVATSGSLVLATNQGGVLRFTSSSAAIFFQFATPASGDIEGVTAGVGISGGGTSGTVTITNSMATTITTNGDTLYGTGSGTFTRLGIGSTGQVLTVAGGVPSWATPAGGSSGLNLIATDSFSAVSAITKDSLFSTTYDNYRILIEFTASAISSFNFYFRSGGSNITSGYSRQTLGSTGTTVNAARTTAAGEGTVANSCDTGRNFIVFDIASPFLTQRKGVITDALVTNSTVTNERYMNISDSTSSCTGFYMYPNTGTITGKVSYYGYGK